MEERGKGEPFTERERVARHFNVDVSAVTPEMIQQLPPRGTGLQTAEVKFETEERLKEADTDYLKKHGVKKVGHRSIYSAEETKDGIEICSSTATRYYFDNKEPEQLPSAGTCVTYHTCAVFSGLLRYHSASDDRGKAIDGQESV